MAQKQASHGGAWKVAYADFVTAMMALFMVLWIAAQDPKVVRATSEYFKNPRPTRGASELAAGVLPFSNERSAPNAQPSQVVPSDLDGENAARRMLLNSVAADFYRLLHLQQDLAEKPIDVEVSSDGLRVTVFDRGRKPVFVGDTAELTEWGRFVLQNLAWVIDHHQFRVIIDGHARTEGSAPRQDYSSWELSTDRAQAARRALVHYAVDDRQIDRVVGYGDSRPIPGAAAADEGNQRLTLSLNLSPHVTVAEHRGASGAMTNSRS